MSRLKYDVVMALTTVRTSTSLGSSSGWQPFLDIPVSILIITGPTGLPLGVCNITIKKNLNSGQEVENKGKTWVD